MLLCQLLIPKAWKPELGTSQALLDRSRTDGEQNFVVLQVLQLLSCDHEQSVLYLDGKENNHHIGRS